MKKKRNEPQWKGSTVWDMAVDAVENHGALFKVDISGRCFSLGGEVIIKNGECTLPLGIDTAMSIDDVLSEIERLYGDYYKSIKSKDSHKSLFGMCKEKRSRNDIMYAEYTNVAQLKLELFVLLSVLAGTFVWTEEMFGNHHYWVSDKYKSLVIFKKRIWKEY